MVAVNDKVLARAREMQRVLRKIEPTLTGDLRRQVADVLAVAESDVPKPHRIGKQIKFTKHTVLQKVKACGGDKVKAAQALGCSLRTVYTVLDRTGPVKRKPAAKQVAPNMEAVSACAKLMVDTLRTLHKRLNGSRRTMVADALENADRDLPANREPKFSYDAVNAAVTRHRGDKQAAAKDLGCSVRNVYKVLATRARTASKS